MDPKPTIALRCSSRRSWPIGMSADTYAAAASVVAARSANASAPCV